MKLNPLKSGFRMPRLSRQSRFRWCLCLSLVCFSHAVTVRGQAAIEASPFEFLTPMTVAAEAQQTAKRHLYLFCGLPGDARHRELMTQACSDIIQSSSSVLGVAPERLHVLAADEEMQSALESSHPEVGLCDRESVQKMLQEAAEKLPTDESFWMVVIGHGHPYGAVSQWNIAGPDIDQRDLGAWTSGIRCSEQVLWLTQPISGFWLKPLARPGRAVITATEADLEFTGTEMPYALAAVLSGKAESQDLEDVDGDGAYSLLDLYLATSMEITGRFRSIDRLQTEHSQLDDNGDGRGSEVQAAYLPAEVTEGETEENVGPDEDQETAEATELAGTETDGDTTAEPVVRPPLIQSRNLDGFRSRFVLLAGLPEVTSDSEEAKADAEEADAEEADAEEASAEEASAEEASAEEASAEEASAEEASAEE